MKKITQVVKSGKVLVSDGAWGTFLQQKGLQAGECPEFWCVTREADVREIAESYIRAGADCIQANSFGANALKLAHYGLAGRAREINEAAAKISRGAAGSSAWVIASMGPTGEIALPGDDMSEIYAAFAEQAIALERGGADAACIETMSSLDEAQTAIAAVRENTELEIICTFTFERNVRGEYRTMMGLSPEDAAAGALEAGAHITGANCGAGADAGMPDIIRLMRAAAGDAPILVHANTDPSETPEQTAKKAPLLIEAGASIIGGCCGTTPGHIAAIKSILNS